MVKNRKTNPLVSIILCTYNRAKYLKKAVQSVINQNYKKWELVIVNDGSNDNTHEILKPFIKLFKNIIYVSQPNRGIAVARNTGLQLASGEIVTFLDSDDTFEEEHISKRIVELKNTKVDFLYGGINCIGPKNKHFAPDVERPGKKIHLQDCLIAGTLFIYKKYLDKENGFPVVPFAEDYELMKLLLKKYSSKKINIPTYNYNVGAENRLCDLYEQGGVAAINKFQGAA